MWLLLALAGTASAQDVVLPPYTPRTTSDFGLAEDLTEASWQALSSSDLSYAGPVDIRRRVGAPAEACWDVKECVPLLFERFPEARLASVGSVGWEDGMVQAKVRFYGFGDPSPIEVVIRPVDPSAMGEFSAEMTALARDLLPLLPPREGATDGGNAGAAVVDSSQGSRQDEERQARDDEAARRADEAQRRKEDARVPPEVLAQEQAAEARRVEAERRRLGLPKCAFQRYQDSGLSYEDWSNDARVRARHGVIEFMGGVAMGDVDRRYDTRVWVEQDERGGLGTVDTYQYESFLQGRGFEGTVALGYLPVWWLEIGVSGGIQLTSKQLTTGWEQTIAGSSTIVDSDSRIYDPASAMVATVMPRLRGYVLPTGVVKPFLLAGATFRMADGYSVPDLALIDYPDRPGALAYGPTVGAGVAFDFPGAASIMLEVPWTWMLSEPYYLADTGLVQQIPEQLVGSGQLLSARMGLGLRF